MTTAPALSPQQLPARPTSSRQKTAADLLSRIRSSYLDVDRTWTDMAEAHGPSSFDRDGARQPFLHRSSIRACAPRSEDERQRGLAWFERLVDEQPASNDVRDLLNRFERATEDGFQVTEARVIVALMIDAYPNARPHSPEAYIASVMDGLFDLNAPNMAIALACHRLKTSQQFLPTLAEIVAKVSEEANHIARRVERMRAFLQWEPRCRDAASWLETAAIHEGGQAIAFAGNDEW